jgi:hypothetical protein
MAGLRVLVGVMSVLLLAGVVALIYGILRLNATPAGTETVLTLPPGLTLEQASGPADALTLLTRDTDGRATLLMVDPKTGKLLGRYKVETSK